MPSNWPVIVIFVLLAIVLAAMARMGWVGRRRRIRLARVAHNMGLQFSAQDLFDLTRRYSGFVLPSAGHSPRAENVLHGRCGGWSLRAFDYHFEVGHGPRRLARCYGVIAADTDLLLPPALLWHEGDWEHRPLAARASKGQVGPWEVIGGPDHAAGVAEAFASFAGEPAGVQILRGAVMLFCPVRWRPSALAVRMTRMAEALDSLARLTGTKPALPRQTVASDEGL